MDSWMQKYERKEDEKREQQLKDALEILIDEYDETKNINLEDRIKKLQKIIEIYRSLMIEAFEYDEKDYKNKTKELEMLREKQLLQKYEEDKDFESWEEYKKEESEKELEER